MRGLSRNFWGSLLKGSTTPFTKLAKFKLNIPLCKLVNLLPPCYSVLMTTTPAHFEIITKSTNIPAVEDTFSTYDEAYRFITDEPMLSVKASHPYFWGNFFEIVLCGGDGCDK